MRIPSSGLFILIAAAANTENQADDRDQRWIDTMKNAVPAGQMYTREFVDELLDIIQTTEYLSTQVLNVKNGQKILEIIENGFRRKNNFKCAILFLTDDRKHLRIAMYSQPRALIAAAERICGMKIADYRLSLPDAPTFRKVVYKGNTVHSATGELMKEMFPGKWVAKICSVFGFMNKSCILTPLHGKTTAIGILVMSSFNTEEILTPSVRHFAASLSTAFELVRESHERELIQKSLARSEALLKTERETLREKNIVLRELLHQIEAEKKEIERKIVDNIEKSVFPILYKLKGLASPGEKQYIDLIERSLSDITSPFINRLSERFRRLTPREIEICTMIRQGLSSKEIASLLNISPLTVHRYREYIRRKLGLINNRIGLATFLNNNGMEPE